MHAIYENSFLHIDAKNQEEIRKLYLHDAWFSGFEYRYGDRTVALECIQPHTNSRIHLLFTGVIDIDMQACGFWGGGNSIVGISLGDMKKLEVHKRTCKENPVLNSGMLEEAEYLNIELEINSGDLLSILCQGLNVCRTAFELGDLILPPGPKVRWGTYADILCAQTDVRLIPYLPQLLVWLQDMNWPGALRIAARLRRLAEDALRPALEAALERAEEEKDEEWTENLRMEFGI